MLQKEDLIKGSDVKGTTKKKKSRIATKQRKNTGVEAAAPAAPVGATVMGWKTNRGHRGDCAVVLLSS